MPLWLGVSFNAGAKRIKELTNKLCSVLGEEMVWYSLQNNALIYKIDAVCGAVILDVGTTLVIFQ